MKKLWARLTSLQQRQTGAEADARRYRALLESAFDGIAVCENGAVREANPGFAQVFGYAVAEVVGRPLLDFIPADSLPPSVQTRLTATEEPLEVLGLRKNGMLLHLELVTTAQANPETAIEVVAVRDITARKQAEAEWQQLLASEREQRLIAETLREVASALTSSLDREEVLYLILAQLSRVVEYDSVSIMLIDNNRLSIVAAYGLSIPIKNLSPLPLEDIPHVRQVIAQRNPIIIPDTTKDARWQPRADSDYIRNWMGVPLVAQDQVLGILNLDKKQPGFYTPRHASLAAAFANQAAIAIQNVYLFEAEREQRQLTEALVKAAAVVSSTLTLDVVLDQILEQVQQVFPGDTCNVMLIGGDHVKVVRWRGYDRFGADQFANSATFSIDEVANLRQMAETGKPIVIADTKEYATWAKVPELDWLRAYVGAPIQAAGQLVGFLSVDSSQPGRFSEADAQRLQAFADHVATAIQNARLYQDLRFHAGQLEERVQERTAQLQAQYARLEAVLENISDGIIVTDSHGRIVEANPVARNWLEETLGPVDRVQLRQTIQDLASRAQERPETILEFSGVDLQLSAAPIPQVSGMEEEGAVVAVHDISHLKAVDRMKTQFVSSVSHELRTPVTTIKLLVDRLQRGSVDKREAYLAMLMQEVDQQAHLVEDILKISRIDAGKLKLHIEPTSLNRIAQKAIRSFQGMTQQRGVNLVEELAEPSPMALVDEEQIEQVLYNLIENAIRYTPKGTRIVVATDKKEWAERLWATVTVADTGLGIPENELPHLFERFYRGERAHQMQIPGTGLGLAIVKETVELHGGKVSIESHEGEGATFTVWLPPGG